MFTDNSATILESLGWALRVMFAVLITFLNPLRRYLRYIDANGVLVSEEQ